MRRPKAPESAGPAGAALWRAVLAEYDLAPHELELLRQAVRVADLLARIDVALLDEELTVPGYNGQPRPNPLLAVSVAQRQVLEHLMRSMALPLPGEDFGKVRSPQQREAAQQRWRQEHGSMA
jgi:hypothetical protein